MTSATGDFPIAPAGLTQGMFVPRPFSAEEIARARALLGDGSDWWPVLQQMMAERVMDAVRAYGVIPSEVLCGFLEDLHAGRPQPMFGPVSDEARFWASMATPVELEAYLTAICEVLGRSHLAEPARKRLMMTLWSGLPDRWKRGFLKAASGNA